MLGIGEVEDAYCEVVIGRFFLFILNASFVRLMLSILHEYRVRKRFTLASLNLFLPSFEHTELER